MYAYAFASLLFTGYIPLLLTLLSPDILEGKSIEYFSMEPTVYLLLLGTSLLFMVYRRRFDKNIWTMSLNIKNIQPFSNMPKLAIALILLVLSSRIAYHILIGSPYSSGNTLNLNLGFNIPNTIVSQIYALLNFKIYAACLVCITFSKRALAPLILVFEVVYGVFITSKFIIFVNLIFMFFYFFVSGNQNRDKYRFALYLIVTLVIFTLIFFFMRGFFGQIRANYNFDVQLYDFYISGISRIMSVLSVYYADIIFIEPLYGASFCRIIGYMVPDFFSLIPHTCNNIDEDSFSFFLGATYRRIIDKDLFSFWSEPFANFRVFGVLWIILFLKFINYCADSFTDFSLKYAFHFNSMILLFNSHYSYSGIFSMVLFCFIFLKVFSLLQLAQDSTRV